MAKRRVLDGNLTRSESRFKSHDRSRCNPEFRAKIVNRSTCSSSIQILFDQDSVNVILIKMYLLFYNVL